MKPGTSRLSRVLKVVFFLGIVRPVILFVIGLNVRNRERLPTQGPAFLISNHNSHLDTVVLMTLFPMRMLRWIRPVAAADYFHKNRLIRWFADEIMSIIPLDRHKPKSGDPRSGNLLQGVCDAIDDGSVVIYFPEGTRGEPEQMANFKFGVALLAEKYPQVPFYPCFLHGLGKALPRGEMLLVPFFCDVFVGEPIYWKGDRAGFVRELEAGVRGLIEDTQFPEWN